MSEIKDGGPVFPRMTRIKSESSAAASYEPEYFGGMSLRDYFVIHAPERDLKKLGLANKKWKGK